MGIEWRGCEEGEEGESVMMKSRDVILALMTALAKLLYLQLEDDPDHDWAGRAASTQSTYLELACKEAGLDYDAVVEMMKQEIINESSAIDKGG